MTEARFRKLALSLPEATEGSHMGHADFRVDGKIFASLPFEGDDESVDNVLGGVGVLKFTPELQDEFIEAWPKCFEPVNNNWGRRGYTRVLLQIVTETVLRRALETAWKNTASKRLLSRTKIATKAPRSKPIKSSGHATKSK